MTDWIIGADLSHWQNRPDFKLLVDAGVRFVVLKATDRRWTDPDFDRNRNEAVKHGLPWLPYAFLRPNDDEATIEHFLRVVGDQIPPALDWETHEVSSHTVETWIDRCAVTNGRDGLCY